MRQYTISDIRQRFLPFFLITTLTYILLSYLLLEQHYYYGFFLTGLSYILIVSKLFIRIPHYLPHYINPFLLLHLTSFILWAAMVDIPINHTFAEIYLGMSIVAIAVINSIFFFFAKGDIKLPKVSKINSVAFNFVKAISAAALVAYLAIILLNDDLTDKRAIKNFLLENTYIGYLYAFSNIFIVCVLYDLIKAKITERKFLKLLVTYGTFFLLVFLIVGERDLLFSYVIGLIVMWSIFKRRFQLLSYYSFILIILLVAPYTQLLKNYLNTDQNISFEDKSFERNGFDDFMVTGYNAWRVYLKDELRTVDKELILDDIGNVPGLTLNSARWFNRVYLNRRADTTGFGFSLALTGYLDLNTLGVFIVYGIVGVIAVMFFNNFQGSVMGVAFLISLVALISYVQRQDLAYFLNISTKFILIPYLLFTMFTQYKRI